MRTTHLAPRYHPIIKQADDGAKLDYFNAHNTTCTTLGLAQGAEHKCLPEQVIRNSHSPPRRAQALGPDPPEDSGTGRYEVRASSTTLGTLGDTLLGLGPSGGLFSEDEVSVQVYEAIDINLPKTQMIAPRTGLNLSGHETLPSVEEQARQPWLGAPRAETAAAWVAKRSARADHWSKQQLAEDRSSDTCLQLEQWGAASVSTPQGVMDSKTQPRADVSPDVNLSDADSPKLITPVHTVAVYSQLPPPMATVTFSQAITPPAGLKDATPKLQRAMTDTLAPTFALADAWAKMEAAQLALDALDAHYSGRAGAMPWCEHFGEISLEWQLMEMGRTTVESSLIYTVERTSNQDDTKGKAQQQG